MTADRGTTDQRVDDAREAACEAALDAVLGPRADTPPPPTRTRRDQLLPALHAVHDRVGWLPAAGLDAIGHRLGLGRAEVFGVASFYGSFALEPRARRVRRICVDVACAAAGAVVPAPTGDLGDDGDDGDDSTAGTAVVAAPCLGRCEDAPAELVTVGGNATAPSASPAPIHQRRDALVLLRRVGVVDPSSLDDYLAHGGYAAARHAAELGRPAVIDALGDAGLVGRGGAAFPAARKWAAVASEPAGPKYVVANADESEPGTFKDRVLLEGDPYAVLEAMTIAGWAVGAEHGVIYVRDEYPHARAVLEHAVALATGRGYLGADAAGLGVPFRVEVRRGAGAYICGEETALFNSIEGHRGEPRSKPPFPTQVGLFGRPTLVHNVETLANVVRILAPTRPGADPAGADGPGPETKLFSVSGSVVRPGVYELAPGTTLRTLVALAGGLRPGRTLQCVLLGGAAGTFVGPEHLDVALTLEGVRAIGATLGSGAVIVLDDTVDLVPVVLRIAAFFRDESCGRCVPCRVGTVRQEEALHRLASGMPLGGVDVELTRLRDVGNGMRDASICGLGQTAWSAIESALDRFTLFDPGRPS